MKYLHPLYFSPNLALACLFIKINPPGAFLCGVCMFSQCSLGFTPGGSISVSPVLTGPDMAYLGSRVAFWCIAPNSSLPVTYELVRDGVVLIATDTDFEWDQPVRFLLKVTETFEGSYHCKATTGGSSGVSNSIKLTVVTPASNTRVISDPSPPVAYEGSDFVLSCSVAKGSHLSYTWFFNKDEVRSSSFLLTGNKLVMGKVTPKHAGYYSCMAWSRVQDTTRISASAEVQMVVKVYVSKPRISFSISKEGDNYHGNVTCWSERGSPPVNFSLSIDDKEVGSVITESLIAWFPIAIVPGLDMGVARCRVTSEVQELMSDPVTLVVVPVGGDVIVEVDYLYTADSELAAARLSCHVHRGTFPYVSWLVNNSVLTSETHENSHTQPVLSHYAIADHRRTLVLTKLGPEECGYYHCRVRDNYDDSGPWIESTAVLVQIAERVLYSSPAETSSTETPPAKAHITTIETITITFCCFLLLVLVLSVGCVYKLFDLYQAHGHIATSNPSSDALPLSAPCASQDAQRTSFPPETDDHNQTVEVTV